METFSHTYTVRDEHTIIMLRDHPSHFVADQKYREARIKEYHSTGVMANVRVAES